MDPPRVTLQRHHLGSSGRPILIRDDHTLSSLAPASQMLGMSPLTTGSRVQKAAPKKDKPKPVQTKECIICITTRKVGRSRGRGFKAVQGVETCEHFQATCNVCIGKMVKEMIVKNELDDNVVVCPFPDCEHVLDHATVKELIFKNQAESWDTALLMHKLRSSDEFIPCLSAECGRYFSIEACRGNSGTPDSTRGTMVECPHRKCGYKMCLDCLRPWHASRTCDMVNIEEEQSVQLIKDMGAKPCPKCGVNIEKHGGCNHMKCRRCKHDFCFQCLVAFVPNMKHAAGCVEAGYIIMNDPRNWAPDNVIPGHGFITTVFGGVGQPQPPVPVALAPPPLRAPTAADLAHLQGFVGQPLNVALHQAGLPLLARPQLTAVNLQAHIHRQRIAFAHQFETFRRLL